MMLCFLLCGGLVHFCLKSYCHNLISVESFSLIKLSCSWGRNCSLLLELFQLDSGNGRFCYILWSIWSSLENSWKACMFELWLPGPCHLWVCVCFYICILYVFWLLKISRWLSGKECACQCRKCMFSPWVGKIPWRRKWQPILVFCLRNPLTEEPGVAKSDTTEQKAQSTVLNSRGSWRTLA